MHAAMRVLTEQGVAALTVRGVAAAAEASTIGVYSRFGSMAGVLDALYERAFELLQEEFDGLPPETADGTSDVVALALAYRRFALASPARYAFMFERPVPGFDPDPSLRAEALRTTFGKLAGRVERMSGPGADGVSLGYLVWTTMHGLISVELTHNARTPLPGWFIEPTPEAGERIYLSGVTAILAGLRELP